MSHGNLKNALRSILDNSEKGMKTLLFKQNLSAKPNDFTFMFFINCFQDVLSQAGKLFDILQCKQLGLKRGQTKINGFISNVEGYRNDEHYQNILCETAVATEQENIIAPPAKRARGVQIDYKRTYFEIIDHILMSLRERFADMQEYTYFELLDVEKLEQFLDPMQRVDALQNKYSNIFDCKSLVNELKYMYIDSDFRKCKSVYSILELVYKLEFTSALPEATKLI